MSILKQKALATQTEYGHSNADIRSIVLQEVIRLHKQYINVPDKKGIMAKYSSTPYKFFMKNSASADDFDWKQVEKCLLDETNINKFLKKDSDYIHPKTKDFFALYCGKEGYNVFLAESRNKNSVISEEKQSYSFLKTEKILIAGAEIIDKEFVAKIKEDNDYTPEQFYTAMYNDASQWYGVISGYDMARNVISKKTELKIEPILESFFNEPQQIDEKVSFVLCGTGGSGKTTLLRKWAIKLCDESNFKVLWITSFEKFLKEGFETIQQNDTNFLVIINDWDHLVFEDPNTTVRKFFNQASSLNNIRLIIGDRVSKGKVYEDYLADRNAVFELDTSENQKIIHEIIRKCPQWKKAVEQLSEDSMPYDSSLYLLLFIVARLNEDKIKYTDNKPEDLFIKIIRSDLKIISDEYNGLAKALYYWGCAYAKYKVSISYNTFLEIAANYQKDANIKGKFESLNRNTITHQKLRGLINVNDGVLKFHHDVLADVGINQVTLKDVGEFDDNSKLDLLDIIIEKGDPKSASLFFSEIVKKNRTLLLNKEILERINRLLKNENSHEAYINLLNRLDLGIPVLKEFADKFVELEYVHIHSFWRNYLERNVSDEQVLNFFSDVLRNFSQYPVDDICFLLDFNSPIGHLSIKNLPIQSVVEDFIVERLKSKDWRELDQEIMTLCIDSCKNQEVQQAFCNMILRQKDWKNLHEETVFFSASNGNESKARTFSNMVLNDKDWRNVNEYIVALSLRCASPTVAQRFSNIVLSDNNWKKTPAIILSRAFEFAERKIAESFSNKVLSDHKWADIDQIVIACSIEHAKKEIAEPFSIAILMDDRYKRHILITSAARDIVENKE